MPKKKIKKKKAKKGILRFLVFGVACLTLSILILMSFSKMWAQIYKKYQEKNNLKERLESLKEKEKELTTDVEKMQDPEYVARYLREKYFYSKKGEYIIRIPE